MNSNDLKNELDTAISSLDAKKVTSLRGRLINAYRKEIKELLKKESLTDDEREKLESLRDNLKEEVNKHKVQLSSRYSKEFVNKKTTFGTIFTMLPNAVSIAINKVKTCISEIKESRNKKEETKNRMEALKSIGLLAATPVVYLGKFVLDKWYAVLGLGAAIQLFKDPVGFLNSAKDIGNFLGINNDVLPNIADNVIKK